MTYRAQGFSFRGFVALADLLFALSAGLLLLDPKFNQAHKPAIPAAAPVPLAQEPPPQPRPDDGAEAQRIRTELDQLTALLSRLEAQTPDLEQRARQILRSE